MTDSISREEADQLADVLNQICSVTMDALVEGDLQQRLEVAAALRQFHAQFGAESAIAPFIMLLVQWLEGQRPSLQQARGLAGPFQRALQTLLQQAPPPARQVAASDKPQEPISRQVLAQLISAVVAAVLANDTAVQQKLAAQLVNIQTKLDESWRPRLGPLLENLRAVLGGVEPHTLPAVPDATYQRLWASVIELLYNVELNEESAHSRLLDRLTHNTTFVLRAESEELTSAFLRSLLDVQRQALESNAPGIATLIAAIRTLLQGLDATPFASLLEGPELDAWLEILGGTTRNEKKE